MDLLAIGGLTFDNVFRVVSLPTTHSATVITDMGTFFGGRAPNVAVMVASLGLRSGIISLVGDDFSNLGYREHLQRFHVDLQGVLEVPAEETTKVFIFSDKSGKQITFVYPGAAACLRGMEPSVELIRESKLVHISSCNNPKFEADAAKTAGRTKTIVSYDPGNQPIESTDYLREIIANTFILFMNDIEAPVVIRTLNLKTVKEILDLGPQIVVVIKKANKSSTIYTDKGVEKIPSACYYMNHPTGTSDGFIAGFLTGYLKGYDLKTMGLLGAVEASIVGNNLGCQTELPSWTLVKTKCRKLFRTNLS